MYETKRTDVIKTGIIAAAVIMLITFIIGAALLSTHRLLGIFIILAGAFSGAEVFDSLIK